MTALEAIKILGFKIPTVLFDKFGIYQNFTVTVSRSKIFLVSNETKKLFIQFIKNFKLLRHARYKIQCTVSQCFQRNTHNVFQ